jgi:acyl-coenzyme A synthetase/AMP-(fatty) acid ligase
MVGFAAALLSGRVSLLPPTHTPEVVRRLAAFAPDVFCLSDAAGGDIDLPQLRYPQCAGDAPALWPVPRIECERTVAFVFTSGSSGVPVPHRKTWGRLVQCIRAGAVRLGLEGRPHALLATVPPQHMYGFESSVLLPMLSGGALCAERPFYPADICAQLASLPAPRALLCTPIHLRVLLESQAQLPRSDLLVSATAPLAQALALEAERRFHGPLMEIYGSTETGQLAIRRTARESAWRLWPAVELSRAGGRTWARGGHLEQPTPLGDELEILADGRFHLHGRLADQVNIAGKRSSLAYLTQQLTGIEGVLDGAFFFPGPARADELGVTRVAAAAVAPSLDAVHILKALRERIDPVFLPRPLLLIERLPRNSTGKLPAQALRALLADPLRRPA